MNLKLIKADMTQKPIVANLLELYAYDFTEFCDFDIGDDGFYGYANLSKYWNGNPPSTQTDYKNYLERIESNSQEGFLIKNNKTHQTLRAMEG